MSDRGAVRGCELRAADDRRCSERLVVYHLNGDEDDNRAWNLATVCHIHLAALQGDDDDAFWLQADLELGAVMKVPVEWRCPTCGADVWDYGKRLEYDWPGPIIVCPDCGAEFETDPSER